MIGSRVTQEISNSDARQAAKEFRIGTATVPARPLEPALYLVATPIGNLGDITIRALETLASISLVTNSSTAIIGAVLGGAGICTAPTMLCHLEPSLKVVSEDFSVPIKLWLVTRREARLSARVERVAAWLHAAFDTKLYPWFRDEFIPPSRFEAELASAS